MTLLPPPWAPDVWQEQDRATLVCRAVLEITHDVRSFHFQAEGEHAFSFEPGQFVTLEVEVDGQSHRRCYTISSPPTRPHLIAITVKRVLGGPVSNWLHDHLLPGSRLTVQAPLGSFTLGAPTAAKYLFMSAGSGITPLMSMTRTLYDLGSAADVLFVHSARTPADIVFRRELEAIAAVSPNIRVVHVCEGDYPSERWMGLRGRLSTAMLQAIAPDLHERETYVCGPGAYMSSVRRLLEDADYDLGRYHEESFSFESLPAQDVSALMEEETAAVEAESDEKTTGVTFSIEFVRSGVTVDCPPGQTVLEAAYAAGLKPPASCVQGMCGTCKTTMISGEVDMQHNGGIRPREITQNKILICCSTPLSPLQVDA